MQVRLLPGVPVASSRFQPYGPHRRWAVWSRHPFMPRHPLLPTRAPKRHPKVPKTNVDKLHREAWSKTGLPRRVAPHNDRTRRGDEFSENKGFGYLRLPHPLPIFRESSVPYEKNASALVERRRFSFDASGGSGRDRQGEEIDKRRNWRPPDETAASVA